MENEQNSLQNFLPNFSEFISLNQKIITIGLIGLIFIGVGALLFKAGIFEQSKVEVIQDKTNQNQVEVQNIIIEVSGEVQKPGVYQMNPTDRIEQALIAAGGLSQAADRVWVAKNLNRAAKLTDGQKIYIPKVGETSVNNSLQTAVGNKNVVAGNQSTVININTASLSELDSLKGIGSVRAQAIIDNRPYSSIDELVVKKVIPESIYNDIKEKITAP